MVRNLQIYPRYPSRMNKMLKDFICRFFTGHPEGYQELKDRDFHDIHHGRDFTVKILADASTNGLTEKEIRHMMDEIERLRDNI